MLTIFRVGGYPWYYMVWTELDDHQAMRAILCNSKMAGDHSATRVWLLFDRDSRLQWGRTTALWCHFHLEPGGWLLCDAISHLEQGGWLLCDAILTSSRACSAGWLSGDAIPYVKYSWVGWLPCLQGYPHVKQGDDCFAHIFSTRTTLEDVSCNTENRYAKSIFSSFLFFSRSS